jgi:MFS family permease
MTLAMSASTPEDAGLASGLINTVTQVGGALGLAVLATLAASHTSSLRGAGVSAEQALNRGYHLAYLVAAGLIAIGTVVAATVLRPREQREAVTGEAAYAEAS